MQIIIERLLYVKNSTAHGARGSYATPSYQENHNNLMPYLWTIVIDISIFLAMFKFKAFNVYLHAIVALFVSLATFITSMPILMKNGIPQIENQKYMQRHYIIGLIIMIFLLLQVILGIVSKISQNIRFTHPYFIYVMNTGHKYLGYGLVILCKIQVFLILKPNGKEKNLFLGLLFAQGVAFFAWLSVKIFNYKLQGTILPKYQTSIIPQVNSLADIEKQNEFVAVFANYVYNIKPLLYHHPCGFRIIQSVKGIELDRYLYGMYGSETFPLVPSKSHGKSSLSLLDDPIAKINISSVYEGLQSDITEVELSQVNLISPKGSIYQLRLSKQAGKFIFKGYSSLNQIGRYFSLTVDHKTTRLYTAAGFLNPQNISFLSKQLNIEVPSSSTASSNKFSLAQEKVQTERHLQVNQSNEEISLLIKLYPKGRLTPVIVNRLYKTLHLSQQRGQGLKLHQIAPGKILIVAGGTGLYPFGDLIDLLYKDHLASTNPIKKQYIFNKNPILLTNPFQHITFHLLLAVPYIEDIHLVTLSQLIQLNKKSAKLKLTMRLRNQSMQFKLKNKQIGFTEKKFDNLVLEELDKQKISKAIICGPPGMIKEIIQEMDNKKIDKDKYLII